MYIQKTKKPKKYDFDLIVIGSGAGGGVAAHLAAKAGKRVGLIESHAIGGDSPNYTCIPTKALLEAAKNLYVVQNAGQYGVKTSGLTFNYHTAAAWKDKAIANCGIRNEGSMFKSDGITLIRGHAHFVSPYSVNVGQRRYTAKRFLIATGSNSAVPLIPGLSDTCFLTYKEAVHLTKLPKSIFIIGGGTTAYEFAQIFSIFGVRVHVAEYYDHILPKEDGEVGDSAEAALNELGVRTHTKAAIVHVGGGKNRKVVTFEQNGQQHRVAVEEIMVAVGKLPNLDLGLENTGIHCSKDGISVNHLMQTSQKHIYAAGDVVGNNLSTFCAIQEGRVAVHNMFSPKKVAMSYSAAPRCLYGVTEIAAVGKTEHQMVRSGEPYQTSLAPIGILGKAMTSDCTSGFVKIIATHTGILLGASIVAPQATEMLQELTFAIGHRQHACEISKTLHPFPSWCEAVRVAADRIKCI